MAEESKVTVTINGQGYPIGCNRGEEEHILALGARIDKVAQDLSNAVGAINDSRLLVMTCLILTDKLNELESNSSSEDTKTDDEQNQIAETIEKLTGQIEHLATELGKD